MKVRIRREPFLHGCRLAARTLPERVIEPALGRFLLQARAGTCTLHIVGTELSLRLELPAVVEEAGEALLQADYALAVVREATADVLTLESAPGRLRALGQDAEFLLDAPAASSLGALSPFPGGTCHQMAADELCPAVRRTVFAAGEELAPFRLRSILWEVEADQVRLVATDNRRLAVAIVSAQAAEDHFKPVQRLLPVRAVDLLGRMAEGQRVPVEARFGDGHALFRAGPATLRARYVTGAFPEWRRVLPGPPRHLIPLPVGPFLAGVRQAAALREKKGARLLLHFAPGWVRMESRQVGAGQCRVQLPLPLAGGKVEIALNPRFLLELLRAFDPESTLMLGLTDGATAAAFSDGDVYTHVLMPLRPPA